MTSRIKLNLDALGFATGTETGRVVVMGTLILGVKRGGGAREDLDLRARGRTGEEKGLGGMEEGEIGRAHV